MDKITNIHSGEVNVLKDNIDAMKIYTETLIEASKVVSLEAKQKEISICCCFITRMRGKIII
jgi:hypothetical protein